MVAQLHSATQEKTGKDRRHAVDCYLLCRSLVGSQQRLGGLLAYWAACARQRGLGKQTS